MKVYITKYALTKGIHEVEAKECSGFDGMITTDYGYFHGEGKEWCRTLEDANKRAEQMRVNKIESMKKQIKKLENMKFV